MGVTMRRRNFPNCLRPTRSIPPSTLPPHPLGCRLPLQNPREMLHPPPSRQPSPPPHHLVSIPSTPSTTHSTPSRSEGPCPRRRGRCLHSRRTRRVASPWSPLILFHPWTN